MSARIAMDCANCPVSDRAACVVLSPEERRELEQLGTGRMLKRGETLFGHGAPPACATLISGALKVVEYDADGNEAIVSLIHPAGFTGELFSTGAEYEVVALTDSRLCVFPVDAFAQTLQRYPALSLALLRRSSGDLAEARGLLALAGRRKARGRVAGLLLALGRAASHSPCHVADRFELVLSRAEMAGLIGLTIETVSRHLTWLEREGLIVRAGRRGIVLRDVPILEALAA